ncbi:STAS-like domain-containing protein [Falsirhodobacter halotolerans]|uniref:STAS-like domain-containing protein n=1 Tax=Falsirhodobacter halotolerans TaxID=1146892 RepID=UPI003CC7F428
MLRLLEIEKAMKTISIAKDFTRFPGGRYRKHGPGSGEEFREVFLLPALRAGEDIVVTFDGVAGYPSSFVEEAFGGLVRGGLSINDIKRHLKLESLSPTYAPYIATAWRYIDEAGDR